VYLQELGIDVEIGMRATRRGLTDVIRTIFHDVADQTAAEYSMSFVGRSTALLNCGEIYR